MPQSELLTLITQTLMRHGIPHMVTGSLASSLYGEPRATHDIDLVVQFQERDVSLLLAAFPSPRFFLREDAVREALDHGGMFNLLDLKSGVKVDFWMLSTDDFDQSRFERRRTERIGDDEIVFSTPEDVVLIKLYWAKLCGGSEKQLIDAIRVYEIQYDVLDHGYLNQWVERLDLNEPWQRVLREAQPLRFDPLKDQQQRE